MALRLSTGLVDKLMATGSFKTIFAGCFIDIWTGAQPTSADDAATGTKLATIYSDGATATLGLNFEATATAGELEKDAVETWSGIALASGTAGWFRLREATDTGTGAATNKARVDGAIGTSGQQMNLGSLSVTSGAPFILSSVAFTLPRS